MKKTNKLSLLVSLAMLSSVAVANGAPYVGAELGAFGYGNNNVAKNLFESHRSDDRGVTGRVSAGYLWDITNAVKLGVEAGVSKNQNKTVVEFDDANLKFKKWGLDTLAVADFAVNDCMNVFAKAGTTYTHNKFAANAYNLEYSVSNSVVVPKAVIGAGYNVSENINLNVSLNHEFERNSSNDSKYSPGTSSVLAGIKYSFS